MPTPTQLLVNVINSGTVAPGGSATVAHGLRSGDKPVAPTLIFPDRATGLRVNPASVNTLTVTFVNDTDTAQSANFRCERGLSNELDSETVTPVIWQGFAGVPAPGSCVVPPTQVAINDDNYNVSLDPAGVCAYEVTYTGSDANVLAQLSTTGIAVGTRLRLYSSLNSTDGVEFVLSGTCWNIPFPGYTMILGVDSRSFAPGTSIDLMLIQKAGESYWVETNFQRLNYCAY